MNRLQFLLRAQTQYSLHSPFVYGLYTEVLFARAPERGPRGRAANVVWRLVRRYGAPPPLPTSAGTLVRCGEADFMVVDRPHRDEARWQRLCAAPHWQVGIDLFSVGLLVHNPRLHRQHFLLR